MIEEIAMKKLTIFLIFLFTFVGCAIMINMPSIFIASGTADKKE